MREVILAALIRALPAELPRFSESLQSLVIATTRTMGASRQRLWTTGVSVEAALAAAFEQLDLDAGIDAIELNLCHSRRPEPENLRAGRLTNMHGGIVGVALESLVGIAAIAGPTELIAANRSPLRALERMLDAAGFAPTAVDAGLFSVATFRASQLLCRLVAGVPEVQQLYRGARPLDAAPMSRAGLDLLATGMSDWMLRQVDASGRTVYKYWPSRGTESEGDNTIRQAMATLCLGRIAERQGGAARDIADRNLAHLVDTYYRREGELGAAIEGDKIKLGAVSLMALAILESPQRQRYAEQLARLTATTSHLQNPDGSFRTFLAPAGRNDCQNFYPGETLLFWAYALKAVLPGVTAEAYMRAFRYYRTFFRAEPNPAFVPWHAQAHVVVRDVIGDPELDAFVFEINDWLLSMQQWDGAPYPDLKGRFYDPARPQLGSPHASATGVYIEGLIDAFALAKLHHDSARTDAYRTALLRGLRNLARLQFRTEADMFYVSRRDAVAGGIRTETYNNEIRVDNVQHGLMGIHRILERFIATDYDRPGT